MRKLYKYKIHRIDSQKPQNKGILIDSGHCKSFEAFKKLIKRIRAAQKDIDLSAVCTRVKQ